MTHNLTWNWAFCPKNTWNFPLSPDIKQYLVQKVCQKLLFFIMVTSFIPSKLTLNPQDALCLNKPDQIQSSCGSSSWKIFFIPQIISFAYKNYEVVKKQKQK